MKQRFLNILITSFLLILTAFQSNSQEATAVLKDKQIRIGEQTQIELRLRSKADSRPVVFPALMDTISKYIEIVEISEIDTSYDESDITIKELSQTITITSWDSGFHAIPPFSFNIGEDEFKTEAGLLEVQTVDIQADADIKDIKDILQIPFSLWDWILLHKFWIGGIILLIIILLLGIYLWKKYRSKPVESKTVVPREKADVLALQKLIALGKEKLWQDGKVKLYYIELSHILREYLENRFHLSALEKTTDEIELLLNYQQQIEKGLKANLLEVLRLADLAKFAKQEPLSSENEAALKSAYHFVEETRIVDEQDEDQEQKGDQEGNKNINAKPEAS